MRGILLEGAAPGTLLLPSALLAAWAAIFFAWGMRLFRWT
jgi:hypothetical protein